MTLLDERLARAVDVRALLPRYPWLVAGMSERRHGNMRIGANGNPLDTLARARFATELGVSSDRVVASVLAHGSRVVSVTNEHLACRVESDGMVTKQLQLFLSVTAADCLPLFFVDGEEQMVGLAHAGWRGLLRGVIDETVSASRVLGGEPSRMHVAIGPSIGPCHYGVGFSVARQFKELLGEDVVARREGGLFLDLRKAAIRLLGRAGIAPSNIRVSPTCTFCEERLFSHRRDGAHGVEAMMAVIGVGEESRV